MDVNKISVLVSLQQACVAGIQRHFRSAVVNGQGGSGHGSEVWFYVTVLGLRFKVTVKGVEVPDAKP